MPLHTTSGTRRWRPQSKVWWIAACFMIGSTGFALGSFPPYFDALSAPTVAWTFFIGSIFFTTASAGQLHDAVAALRHNPTAHARGRRVWTWPARRRDLWAALVQFVGTIFFNLSTGRAIGIADDTASIDRLVWRPDVFGSIAFLVASYLAIVGHAWKRRMSDLPGMIAGLNLVGSIAFGISAVAAYVIPTTGDYVNIVVVNAGTFVGAVCFFVGAALLIPESEDDEVTRSAPSPA